MRSARVRRGWIMVKEDIRSMLWLDEGADQVRRNRATRSGRFDDALVAVFVRLEDEGHGDLRGHWFLEAGFGRCNPLPQSPAFPVARRCLALGAPAALKDNLRHPSKDGRNLLSPLCLTF